MATPAVVNTAYHYVNWDAGSTSRSLDCDIGAGVGRKLVLWFTWESADTGANSASCNGVDAVEFAYITYTGNVQRIRGMYLDIPDAWPAGTYTINYQLSQSSSLSLFAYQCDGLDAGPPEDYTTAEGTGSATLSGSAMAVSANSLQLAVGLSAATSVSINSFNSPLVQRFESGLDGASWRYGAGDGVHATGGSFTPSVTFSAAWSNYVLAAASFPALPAIYPDIEQGAVTDSYPSVSWDGSKFIGTISHTLEAGTDLLVVLEQRRAGTTSTIEWNGTSVPQTTQLSDGNQWILACHLLPSPESGTHNLTVVRPNSTESRIVVFGLTGVDTINPLRDISTDAGWNTAWAATCHAAPGDRVYTLQTAQYTSTITGGQFPFVDELSMSGVAGFSNISMETAQGPTSTASYSAGTAGYGALLSLVFTTPSVKIESVSTTITPDTTYTLNTPAGNGRMLIAVVRQGRNPPNLEYLTFDGVQGHVVAFADVVFDRAMICYWLDSELPATAGTYNIARNTTIAGGTQCELIEVTGADQVAPTFLSGVEASATSLGVAVPAIDPGLLVYSVLPTASSGTPIVSDGNETYADNDEVRGYKFDEPGFAVSNLNTTEVAWVAAYFRASQIPLAVRPIGTVSLGGNSGGTTITVSHEVMNVDSNRYLLALAAVDNTSGATAPSSMTYGGVAMTQIAVIEQAYTSTYIYGLANPAVGTADVVMTFPSSIYANSLAAVTMANVHQTTPAGTPQTKDTGGAGTDQTLGPFTEDEADLLVDIANSRTTGGHWIGPSQRHLTGGRTFGSYSLTAFGSMMRGGTNVYLRRIFEFAPEGTWSAVALQVAGAAAAFKAAWAKASNILIQ